MQRKNSFSELASNRKNIILNLVYIFNILIYMKKNLKNTKKWAFTLVELLLVCMILSLIMPSIFALYSFMIDSNREISARQDVVQQGYEFLEKLNILMQDYTIDYEEYYNRQMVGCREAWDSWEDFKWNTNYAIYDKSGYCDLFTTYWNENSTHKKTARWQEINTGFHNLYYCSSDPTNNPDNAHDVNLPVVVSKDKCWKYGKIQSFWQYEAFFTDVHKNTESAQNGSKVWDSDDENLWGGENGLWTSNIRAIADAENIQELYLISNDWKSRLYFRRKLIQEQDWYAQYKIQMLRLKWFDAWYKHNFSITSDNIGLYDGKIDTWVCDSEMWFVWQGNSIDSAWWAYSKYHLPKDVDDCWVDITQWWMSVLAWNITISPTVDSKLSWNSEEDQINPFIKLFIVNWVYRPYYSAKMAESIADFKMPIETTFNIKSFYTDY